MVSALLVLLAMAVLQLGLMIHVRNTLIDAASTGARLGALHDRTAEDGADRTARLIESSVASRYAGDIGYEYEHVEEGRVLRITVRAQIPLFGLLPGVGETEVNGSAYEFE